MIRRYHKVFIIIMTFTTAGCWANRPLIVDTPLDVIAKSLNDTVPELMDKNKVVGMSVVVIRDNKMALSRSFGYRDLTTQSEVTSDTVYKAASLGKPLFAYIVVALAQQKKFDLDKPLYTYLGEKVVASDVRSKDITARMVLSHTSGLPNLGKKVPAKFHFEPGEGFKYSGYGYEYLQRVIETHMKKNLNELANEFVFEPLSMAATSYVWRADYQGKISNSYRDNKIHIETTAEPQSGHAAWSLYTTPEDYAKFVIHTMKKGQMSGTTAALLLEPAADVAIDVQWGLGWGIQDTDPNQSFWHWGSMAGFKHYVVAYPKEQIAVIVMSNSDQAFKMIENVMIKSIGGRYPSYEWF